MTGERLEIEPKPAIRYWFFVRQLPYGRSPEEIRAGMVNIPMPVREPLPVEGPQSYVAGETDDLKDVHRVPDGVFVTWSDGAKSLRLFQRIVSAEWLEEFQTQNPQSEGMVFDRAEGEIIPSDLAERLVPGLEDFDQL